MSKKKIDNLDVLQENINIPEDEIWTYQVPGLAAPHIGKPFKNAKSKIYGSDFFIYSPLFYLYFTLLRWLCQLLFLA